MVFKYKDTTVTITEDVATIQNEEYVYTVEAVQYEDLTKFMQYIELIYKSYFTK